ncbi:MAG TPA: heavy-metal-associated domain-containing protein [Actinomycetota bacterium]|nr:heavy-metal-associated domain-containing protein [Actinomycetota bacterium]
MTTRIRVADATCGHCKQTVEAAVGGVAGVTAADLDLDSKLLVVEHGSAASAGDLVGAIEAAGYTPELTR